MARRKLLDYSIPLIVFVFLTTIVVILYAFAINKHYSVIEEQVHDTGRLLSKEFYKQYRAGVSKLEDLKKPE